MYENTIQTNPQCREKVSFRWNIHGSDYKELRAAVHATGAQWVIERLLTTPSPEGNALIELEMVATDQQGLEMAQRELSRHVQLENREDSQTGSRSDQRKLQKKVRRTHRSRYG